MANETAPALAIKGGPRAHPESWANRPAVAAASDGSPIDVLEAEFAVGLGLDPSTVIALASAADARRWALQVAVPGRTELVLPALGATEWVSAAQAAGFTVVPAETDSDTAAISARGFSAATSPQSGAVVVTYPFGHAPVLDTVLPVARESGCTLIEECSEAVGASYREAPAGAIGRVAVFAIGTPHLLSGGVQAHLDGGALLVMRDAALASRIRREAPPLDEPVARIALAEWRGREEELRARRELAWELTFNLRGMRGVASMPHGRWIRHAYDRYVFRLRSMLWKRSIEETLTALEAEGLPVEAALPPSLAADVSLNDDRTQAANRLPREMIALPLHSGLTSRDMDLAAQAIRKVERWAL